MGTTKFQHNMRTVGQVRLYKQAYPNGTFVKFHKKWCNHPAEHYLYWMVMEFNDVTNRYKIGLVGYELIGRVMGSTEVVSADMIYQPKGQVTDQVIETAMQKYSQVIGI